MDLSTIVLMAGLVAAAFLLLDQTLGRRLRSRRREREIRKMRARAIRHDLSAYERRVSEEPVDALVLRHLRPGRR